MDKKAIAERVLKEQEEYEKTFGVFFDKLGVSDLKTLLRDEKVEKRLNEAEGVNKYLRDYKTATLEQQKETALKLIKYDIEELAFGDDGAGDIVAGYLKLAYYLGLISSYEYHIGLKKVMYIKRYRPKNDE